MSSHRLNSLEITEQQDSAVLSKSQKTFNRLIQQLGKKREQLAAWENTIPAYERLYAAELAPLYERTDALRFEAIKALDQIIDRKGLTKTDRRSISAFIVELAGALLSDCNTPELQVIFNRHSDIDFDEIEAERRDEMKFMLESMLGVEFDDDADLTSPDDILKYAQASLQEKQAQLATAEETQAQVPRKKTAKQLAKEEQQQLDEKQVSLSIREIYRKLASELHPDREPDPQERERKNALMQRVNHAYERKNLLQLLELQLELEHIDQSGLNNIGEERLKHYNKILKEQLLDLDRTIMEVEGDFRMRFGLSPVQSIAPDRLIKRLTSDIAAVKCDIQSLTQELKIFGDVPLLKSWLKDMKRNARRANFDDDLFYF